MRYKHSARRPRRKDAAYNLLLPLLVVAVIVVEEGKKETIARFFRPSVRPSVGRSVVGRRERKGRKKKKKREKLKTKIEKVHTNTM